MYILSLFVCISLIERSMSGGFMGPDKQKGSLKPLFLEVFE